MSLAIAAKRPWVTNVAKAGLISKGIVYVILGALAFMAAFEIGGQTNSESGKTGALQFLRDFPGGKVLLVLLAAGLLCYSAWRFIQALSSGSEAKWPKRARYFFSGLVYLSLAGTAFQVIRDHNKKGDDNQYWVSEMLSHSFGQLLLGIGALVLAGVGIYQLYYGLSEKYRKHVRGLSLQGHSSSLLLRAGKIGYISRGIVWLVIAYLFIRAAVHNKSAEAGDTGKAFEFIESSAFGSYLLGALGIGLIAYGVFNLIRARYEFAGNSN